MGKTPQPLSPGEEEFSLHCKAHNLTPEREYKFGAALGRQWRCDFAFPDAKMLIEIEGGSWKNGRHSRGVGFEMDCVKYNTAAILGWRLYRFTTGLVSSGYAIATTRNAIRLSGIQDDDTIR